MEDKCYSVALQLVRNAGNLVREAFHRPSGVEFETKSSSIDLVTEIDRNVEALLVNGLKAEFPDHTFIGEESTALGKHEKFTDSPTWLIDPIDGTTNFVHRLPFVCISVGFYVNKRPSFGIIYNPILEDLFTARQGQGAYKNGFPIHVSKTTGKNRGFFSVQYFT
ncbi:unnamed protein product [Soboliphyme baturini]|uniref:Inositol-1-monophosphatase n=1 Tax=Soboliphyme baturini TaxID=241478 RepID=A0A183J582_9BILA|nr:unnamed protein product [Soboliphyme baturini]